MTFYICQLPHQRAAQVWTAETESEIVDKIVGDSDNTFSDALSAAQYDMRDAYITADPLDLFHWASLDRNAIACGARRAVLAHRDVQAAVRALAEIDEAPLDPDATIYLAFDARFQWNDDDNAWRLDNGEPVEADDLVEALCEASLKLALTTRVEQTDA